MACETTTQGMYSWVVWWKKGVLKTSGCFTHKPQTLSISQCYIFLPFVLQAQSTSSNTPPPQDTPYEYQQYLYGQSSKQVQEYGSYSTSATTTGAGSAAMPLGGGYNMGRGEVIGEVVAPTATSVPMNLPSISMEQVKKKLKDRYV